VSLTSLHHAYRLEVFLDLCHTTGRIVWVSYVVFVYPEIAACSAQHEIDKLCHGPCLMLVEPRNPSSRNIF
jgi:hypothetical protein